MAALRVYVAGASAEIETARKAMVELRDAGCVITHDWVADVDAEGARPDDADVAQQCAKADLKGVRTADVVWVMTPEDKSRGAGLWVELGAALAFGVPVVVSGPQTNRSIFASLGLRVPSHAAALQVVLAARGTA